MERERFDDEDKVEREVDVDQPVYGDTDINPNSDDQRDAHRADSEEHL